MRADRLFSIVLLLQNHRLLTSSELARRLEVSARTIHRDMEALSGVGIPVVAERGTGGGWSLLGEYRTNLTGLNEAEIQSLFVNRSTRVLKDLRLEKAAEGAFLKLLAALPSAFRRGAEHARERIHIDVPGWSRKEESVPLLHVLQDAVWHERRLRISYGKTDCGPVERLIDPLGIVAKGSAWYLIGMVDGGARTYRVSSVLSAQPTGEQFKRPDGFDLAEYWETSSEKFRSSLGRYRMRARARREIVVRLPYGGRFVRVEKVGEPDENGWVEVALNFDAEEIACEYALSFGELLEVIEPESLREKVCEAARRVVAIYERR
jgi:predicted DNA-binding transcriptional regulator YafY